MGKASPASVESASAGPPSASQASSSVASRRTAPTSALASSSSTTARKVEVRTIEKKLFKEGKKDVRQYTFEVEVHGSRKLLVIGRYSDLRIRCLPIFGSFPSNHLFGDYTKN